MWFSASVANACSVCSCGDPSTVCCSKEAARDNPRWAVALESRYFSKSNTNDARDGTESHFQTQVGIALSRTFRSGFEIYGRLPYVTTLLKTTGTDAGSIRQKGLGDGDLLAKFTAHTLSDNWVPSLSVGAKVPTGNNNVQSNGTRITEHAQPGTGSWDGYAILNVAHPGTITWSGAVGYRFNGVNKFGQRYGRVSWVQVTGSRSATSWLKIDFGTRFRGAARDIATDGFDPNSGGNILCGLLTARAALGKDFAFQVSGSVPVATNLNGTQKERPLFEGGLVATF
jgi:hypothetical protein